MKELSLQIWQLVLGTIGLLVAVFVAYFTGRSVHFQKKQTKETLPQITQIKPNKFRKDDSLEITIVNCKQHPIALEDIKYKKRFRLPKKAIWNYPISIPSKQVTHTIAQEASQRLYRLTHQKETTYISDQLTVSFSIPDFNSNTSYRIIVETSVGKCSLFYKQSGS